MIVIIIIIIIVIIIIVTIIIIMGIVSQISWTISSDINCSTVTSIITYSI